MSHYCYLLISINPKFINHSYVGYTTDINRRIKQHNGLLKGGSKSTRIKKPFIIYSYIIFDNKNDAMKIEYQIKKFIGFHKRNEFMELFDNYFLHKH